ncbi:MAG: sigma-70 family RNA polymerase sigma factor, partial [Anaerolineae bacterium]|nr:sigma-70 family RNA polymerase sigma factor [Anaerolineae bacterium]
MPGNKKSAPLRSGERALEQETRADATIQASQTGQTGNMTVNTHSRAMSCQYKTTRHPSEIDSGNEFHNHGARSEHLDHAEVSVEVSLIDALKTYDDEAWGVVFNCCQDRLRHDIVASLRRRGLDSQYADDIVGETWLTAAEKIVDLECQDFETFYHWIRVISYNRVRNLARKKRPMMSFQDIEETQIEPNSLVLDAFLWSHTLIEMSPEREAETREQKRQLEQSLYSLSPRDRELWLRRHLDGHSPAQMATDFSLKPRS